MKILRINSSAQGERSTSRKLVNHISQKLADQHEVEFIDRDLRDGVSLITEAHIGAYFTPPEQRNPEQEELLKESDALVDELEQADAIILGVAMYNFSIPASLKGIL